MKRGVEFPSVPHAVSVPVRDKDGRTCGLMCPGRCCYRRVVPPVFLSEGEGVAREPVVPDGAAEWPPLVGDQLGLW